MIVTETVLLSALVEVSVAVKTPLAFVVPELGVTVVLEPVTLSATLAPEIGLPKASSAVTETVEALDPVLAMIVEGEPETADCEAETSPALMSKVALVASESPAAPAVSV